MFKQLILVLLLAPLAAQGTPLDDLKVGDWVESYTMLCPELKSYVNYMAVLPVYGSDAAWKHMANCIYGPNQKEPLVIIKIERLTSGRFFKVLIDGKGRPYWSTTLGKLEGTFPTYKP